jgi:hypothetical protein
MVRKYKVGIRPANIGLVIFLTGLRQRQILCAGIKESLLHQGVPGEED